MGFSRTSPTSRNTPPRVQPHELSLWFGTALIAIGVAVNLFSARRYMRLVGELNRGQFVHRSLSKQGVIVALFLALLGIAMTIYLTLVLAQPPDALHAQLAGMATGAIGEKMMEGSKKHYVDKTASILFGGSDHPTKGAKKSGGSLRSDRLLPHSDGAVLHTQSFSDAKLGPRLLSTTHRWCGQASVHFELRGVAKHAIRDPGRDFGVRR